MKLFLIMLGALSISACSIFDKKEQQQVISYQTVTRKIPQELLQIPEYPNGLHSASTQKDLSIWLIEDEKRIKDLERKLKLIKEFNDKD